MTLTIPDSWIQLFFKQYCPRVINYLELFLPLTSEAALAADLARVVGFSTLLGLSAFRILNAAHAVPMAWPAASSPSLVASAAFSPYLELFSIAESQQS